MKANSCCETMSYWYDQLWNHRNPTPIDTLLADNFILHGHGGEKITKQGFREFFDAICNGFSATQLEVLDSMETGNRCAMRVSCKATLTATGKTAEFQMMAMVQFNEEGLVEEAWDTLDWYGFLTRVDALPADTLQKVIGEGAKFAVS